MGACCDCLKSSSKQLNSFGSNKIGKSKLNDIQAANPAELRKNSLIKNSWKASDLPFYSPFNQQDQNYIIKTKSDDKNKIIKGQVNEAYQSDSQVDEGLEVGSVFSFPPANYVYKLQPSALKAIVNHINETANGDSSEIISKYETMGDVENENDDLRPTRKKSSQSFQIIFDQNASF